jgi:hypothetical protein
VSSHAGRRKNDVIDASAAASVAALQGDAREVAAEDHTTLFALLEQRRANLAAQRVQAVNQLHALMRDLIPAAPASRGRLRRGRSRLRRAQGHHLHRVAHGVPAAVLTKAGIGRAT